MDEIEIVEADPDWPARFEDERLRLEIALTAETILSIEHFGSTAVPGLAAKPIIDILIAVPSVARARSSFPAKLNPLGYVYWAENPKTDRLFFVKGMPPFAARRSHHIHVCERPSEMWDRLKFRDYLIENPQEAGRYADLKVMLADKHRNDREAYTRAKDSYIRRIMDVIRASD